MVELLASFRNTFGYTFIELIKENGLAVLAVILISGVVLGKLAYKIKLPGIIGHIAAGILIGPYVLKIFTNETLHHYKPITDFALGLITVTVGSHLNYRKLHNAIRRMSALIFVEVLAIPIPVFLTLYFICRLPLPVCLILSSIALATAPATVIHIIRENRAKGIFVKTLVSEVALNNVFCVFLFEITTSFALFLVAGESHLPGNASVFLVLGKLMASILIGAGVGFLLIAVTEKIHLRTGFFNFSLIAILVTVAVEKMFSLSPLLSCLVLGIVLGNFAPKKLCLQDVFKDLDYTIYACFFTMAGAHLKLHYLATAGVVTVLYVLSRGAGKIIAPFLASKIVQTPKAISKWLGFSLMPQAGMAVGLIMVIDSNEVFSTNYPFISTIVLTAVMINEIVGPLFVKLSLKKSGEIYKDRSRIIEFLHEEYILLDDIIQTKKKALEKLVDFLIVTHHLEKKERKKLLASVLEREEELPTDLGKGVAIPHGIIEGGSSIIGVIGIFKKGIDFEESIPPPVNVVILLMVPRNQYNQLLSVTISINKILGTDDRVTNRLAAVKNAAEAYEVITEEELDKFNYFMDEIIDENDSGTQ